MRDTVQLQGDADAVAADTKRYFSRQRLERSAARDERSRVSREVHDGVLQVLTGVSLQLWMKKSPAISGRLRVPARIIGGSFRRRSPS